MRRYSKKALAGLIGGGYAKNITDYSFQEVNDLRRQACLRQVGYCSGVYGVCGALLEDMNTGELYAITKRNCTLLQLV